MLTYEFVKSEFEKAGFEMISTKYIKAIDKLTVKCKAANHIVEISYNKLTVGRGCKKCSGNYIKSYEEIVEFFKSINYELLSAENEYVKIVSFLKFKCDNGHTNEMRLSSLRSGHKCSICTGNKKLTYEFVKDEFEKKGLTLITETYTNARTKMKFICNANKHSYQATYDDIKQGGGCARCIGTGILTHDDIKKEFEKEGFELLSKTYKNAHETLEYKCEKGHLATISYTHFQSGRRCKICIESLGERAVRKYLESNQDTSNFKSEYKFKDCKNIRPLPFDFYVMDKFLIEFDGKTHFQVVEGLGGETSFNNIRKTDKIKTNYCREKKIPLLRISYKHIKKIPEIIIEFMEKLKQTPDLIYFTDKDLYEYLSQDLN